MTAPTPNVQSQTQPPANVAPTSQDATTAGAVASSNGGAEVTSSTKINSLDDLKKKSPELYRKMMEGIAMSICSDMKEHQDRLKQMMAEARRNAGQG